MAVLIIREAGQPDRSFSTKKKEIFIGRGKSCDIILPHITVSKEHAKVYKLQDSYFIEDISGQSNILVNQQQRQRFELSSKDEIQIAKFTLIFFGDNLNPLEQFFEGKALDEFPPYARTTTSNRKDATFQMSPAMVQKMLASSNKIRQARVQGEGSEWQPGDKILGFGKSGQIPVKGWFTGGVVAEIHWSGSDHILKKTGSFTTVSINGEKLKSDHFLKSGDKITVGGSNFTYTIVDV